MSVCSYIVDTHYYYSNNKIITLEEAIQTLSLLVRKVEGFHQIPYRSLLDIVQHSKGKYLSNKILTNILDMFLLIIDQAPNQALVLSTLPSFPLMLMEFLLSNTSTVL